MQRSILVDLAAFRIAISEYDAVVRTITSFSVGRAGHRTPTFEGGSLSLTKREKNHRSSIYPPPHGGALMRYALFFTQAPACAFHQGDPAVASHGCIHLAEMDARWLWDWAGSSPVGLTIRGPYPASPVPRQTLYRLGAANMLPATVQRIERALAAAGFDPGPADGGYTVETDEAVRAFQEKHALVIDGVVGRDTARVLGIEL